MKTRGFVLPAGLALALVIAFISGGALWSGAGWVQNYRSDALKDECNQLDYAVRRYGQNHRVVDTSSEHMDANGTLQYNTMQTYPASQAKLSELYDLGYLPRAVKLEDFKQDNSVTFYTVNSDKTKYRIKVTLPNGKTYITPGSSSF